MARCGTFFGGVERCLRSWVGAFKEEGILQGNEETHLPAFWGSSGIRSKVRSGSGDVIVPRRLAA